jgi:hypothetical protein
MNKILVSRQQRQFVADTELGQQSVNGADLHARAAAGVAQFGSVDMVLPIRDQ